MKRYFFRKKGGRISKKNSEKRKKILENFSKNFSKNRKFGEKIPKF